MALKQLFDQPAEQKEDVEQYLLHGIKVNVAPSGKKFAEDLFDSLASIPTGRNAIADMKKYGVGFSLETGAETAGDYFDPDNNRIVMAQSLGMDFMEFALIHEARHLWQNNQGRSDAAAEKLDYATRLMINRATEADAQTQAFMACKEWEAQGRDAPIECFTKHYAPLVRRFEKTQNLSDAFKGWYDDERICAGYEQNCDINPALSGLTEKPDDRPYVSMRPAEIARFCGGERIEGFEEFLQSKQARQVHRLTKTALELFDETAAAKGAPRDPSLKDVPLRSLYGNSSAQIYAMKCLKETKEQFNPAVTVDPQKKEAYAVVSNCADLVKHANAVEVAYGKNSAEAENAVRAEAKKIRDTVKPSRPGFGGNISRMRRVTGR